MALPTKINYPHNYHPHEIARLAALDLIERIPGLLHDLHDFGIDGSAEGLGKMFGVLVVRQINGELGYLSAFSGKLQSGNQAKGFVPPIFDTLDPKEFYLRGENEISQINEDIFSLSQDASYLALIYELEEARLAEENKINSLKERFKFNKQQRKLSRKGGNLSPEALEALNHESSREHYLLKDTKKSWTQKIKSLEDSLIPYVEMLNGLKELRKQKSNDLQKRLFASYHFLNVLGEEKSLGEIFVEQPPSGAGECAAPKLFQYAFREKLEAVAMAEFWYGKSPSSEVRRHLQYYPACRGKCEPILKHMLFGTQVDEDPLLSNNSHQTELDVLYEDEVLIVIHKPEGLLSVPGKEITDSVLTRIMKSRDNLTGPVIVHRLDMSTSGIMILAKDKDVHKDLQHQFESREIQKTYVALLDSIPRQSEGMITLPLRVDLDDRPRQMVCYEYGKEAVTYYKTLSEQGQEARVRFFPKTGRTHQLRVHAAHVDGLNAPIKGDDLYGSRAGRLHLHAEQIIFRHPITGKKIEVKCPADF